MSIFPEESLNSFILRTLMRHGLLESLDDLSGVLTQTSSWIRFPVLKPYQRPAFFTYSTHTLLTYIEDHTLFSIDKQFSDPRVIPALYDMIFFGRTEFDALYIDPRLFEHEQLNIFYCPICFCDQLQSDGITWFKKDWLRDNKYCSRHGIELVNIKFSTCCCESNIRDKLLSIMSGLCTKCGQPSWPFVKKTERPSDPIRAVENNHKNGMHIAPCLMWSLYELLEQLEMRLHASGKSIIPSPLQMFLLKLRKTRRKPPNLTAEEQYRLCLMVKKYMPDFYRNYFILKSEVITINTNPVKSDNIFVPYIVCNSRNCITCQVEKNRCPLCR